MEYVRNLKFPEMSWLLSQTAFPEHRLKSTRCFGCFLHVSLRVYYVYGNVLVEEKWMLTLRYSQLAECQPHYRTRLFSNAGSGKVIRDQLVFLTDRYG